MLSKARLQEVLQGLGLKDATVEVEGSTGHLFAKVVSNEFNGQDEAARQARIWKHLYDALSEVEHGEVEFVFTVTPDEYEAEAGRFEDLAGRTF